jgi:Xaa-Pro aminopeptidase
MRTMHNVVGLGSYSWDQEWLPIDEFEERLRAVRRAMAAEGWSGLMVHGDSQESAVLTYLTNFFPRNRWAVALFGAEGPGKLMVATSARDLPIAATLTWMRDVASFSDAGKLVPAWVEGLANGAKPKVAVAGGAFMRRPVHDTVVGSAAKSAEIVAADAALGALLGVKRPRELSMIRKSCAILEDSVAALDRARREGASVVAASIEAERVARLAGAQDIRVLFSLDGGKTLRPFEETSDVRCDPLVAYLAVRYLGYWSEALVTLSDKANPARDTASKSLDALIAAAKPGASVASLATAAGNAGPVHPTLGARLGHGIGLSLDEDPVLDLAKDTRLAPGEVYSLHVGSAGTQGCALLSAMVAIGADGAELMWQGHRR